MVLVDVRQADGYRRGVTVRLPSSVWGDVVAHAQAGYPFEVCGLIAVRRGSLEATRAIRLPNVAYDPAVGFVADPAAEVAAYADADAAGEDLLILYHSHPSGRLVLSSRDVAMSPPGVLLWLVVGGNPLRGGLWRVTRDASGARVEPFAWTVVDDHGGV